MRPNIPSLADRPSAVSRRAASDPTEFPPSWADYAAARERALRALAESRPAGGRRRRHLRLVRDETNRGLQMTADQPTP